MIVLIHKSRTRQRQEARATLSLETPSKISMLLIPDMGRAQTTSFPCLREAHPRTIKIPRRILGGVLRNNKTRETKMEVGHPLTRMIIPEILSRLNANFRVNILCVCLLIM